jgi:hypothetical protein
MTSLAVQLEEVARGDGQSPGLVAQLEEVRRILRAVEPRDEGGVGARRAVLHLTLCNAECATQCPERRPRT